MHASWSWLSASVKMVSKLRARVGSVRAPLVHQIAQSYCGGNPVERRSKLALLGTEPGNGVDLVLCQLDVDSRKVLLQVLDAGGAGDGQTGGRAVQLPS